MTIPSVMPDYPTPFVSGTGKQHYLTGYRTGRHVQALCWLWLDREVSLTAKTHCKKCATAYGVLKNQGKVS